MSLRGLNGMGFQNPFRVADDPLDDINNSIDSGNDLHEDLHSNDGSIVFERFGSYDGSIPSSESSTPSSTGDVQEPSADNKITRFGQRSASNLMLLSLLEHMCTLYVDDDETSERLFSLVCEKLYGMKLMQNFGSLDDVKAIRQTYQTAFVSLMGSALESLKSSSNINPLNAEKVWQMTSKQNLSCTPTQSWYKDMFCDESKIAFGGFGEVVKAKNKLDQKCYAIKKVKLIESQPDVCYKTLREVQVFSDLNHSNIVRYHCSWLEYGLTEFKQTQKDECDGSEIGEQEGASSVAAGDRFSNEDGFGKFNVSLVKNELLSQKFISYQNGTEEHPVVGASDNNIELDEISPQSPNDDRRDVRKNSFTRSFSSGDVPFSNQQMEEISYCHGKFYRGNLRRAFNMTLFIQMELCQVTLRKWIDERNSKIKEARNINASANITIFKQIIAGLQYIHDQGLIHRDIKPANIFINFTAEDMVTKIGDFGLARNDNLPQTPTSSFSSYDVPNSYTGCQSTYLGHTKGVGTAVYAAPEQKVTSNYTNTVDIFSAGIILFELFRLFRTEMERLTSINDLLNVPTCATSDHNCLDVCKLILEMTLKEPDQRPSACSILNLNLAKLAGNNNTDTDRIDQLERKLCEQEMEINRLQHLLREMESKLCSECQLLCPHQRT